MKTHYIDLIQYLTEKSDDWISSKNLADKCDVSKRTIKSYISEINAIHHGLILSSNKGYKVNTDQVNRFLTSEQKAIPQTQSERMAYILKKLVQTNEPIYIYDLSDALFISESTLRLDLKLIKEKLGKNNLELQLSKDHIELQGREKDKRKLMSSILYEEANGSFIDIDKIKGFYKELNIDYIREVVVETFSAQHFFTNDYYLTNVIIHITIALDRMKHDFQFLNKTVNYNVDNTAYLIAKEIAFKLESYFHVTYPEEEITDLAILISCNATNVNFTQIEVSDLENIAGKDCIDLVSEIAIDLDKYYYISIADSDFITRFTLHVKNLLMRLKNHHSTKNPLTQTIKRECPLIYDCAVHASHVIKEKTGYIISDDEIAYLAFHLGYAIELQRQSNVKISCTVLFPLYYNMNVQIINKLQQYFGDDILIHSIVTDESDLNYATSDFIISSAQLHKIPEVPYVVITPFFIESDREKVSNKIFELKEQKKKNQFKIQLESFLDERHFYNSTALSGKEDVLRFICQIMNQDGYTDEDFWGKIMEREAMSSTAFGHVAIPHAIKMESRKTGMFIYLNPNGIKWDSSTVKIVLLLTISGEDRKIFRDVFDALATILTDDKNVNLLSSTHSFDDFINKLITCWE
ncbi:BglG family transcription antiterminator [Paenibacillus peoriae]|uniref:BglG family transcription antiterminator n=1 Tax=Paenibacillus peoriae TaxID=59893 RepID=UPI00026C6114|nr:BglG family transcription antiterminator [Paenibacillus peoriae]MEC0184768.1 BglG family transcription antiterminator [Paenibacillus peoriae]